MLKLVLTPMIIGYYAYWSASAGMKVEDIPGDMLTHVIYAFASISNAGECKTDEGQPVVLSQFRALKKRYPKLKVMMAVGGWTGSKDFSTIAASEPKRIKFAASCVKMMNEFGLDGIDVDWEFPVSGGMEGNSRSPDDPKNFVLLMAELRKQLGFTKVLSVAVSAYRNDTVHLDIPQMSLYVDWFGLMAYDYYGSFSDTTGHHAGLFGAQYSKTAVDIFLAKGAKPEQLVLGLPFYGHAWANVPAKNNGLYQSFKGVPATRLGDGAVRYGDLPEYLSHSTKHFDSDAKASWLYDSHKQIMVSYEGPESIKAKSDYVKKAGLGGVMVWELNQDNKKGELLRALHDGLRAK